MDNSQDSSQNAPDVSSREEGGEQQPKLLEEREIRTAADFLRSTNPKGRPCTLEKLGADVYREYLEGIKRGCFHHIAAQALGVMPGTLSNWLVKGAKAKSGMYRAFYEDTMMARGAARRIAESLVFVKSPITWLKSGPGREDWAEKSILEVGGRIETVEGELTPGGLKRRKLETMGEALCVLEELGLIQRTPQSEIMFKQLTGPKEDGNGNGETEVIDVLAEEE